VLPGAHGPLTWPVLIQPVLQFRDAETPNRCAIGPGIWVSPCEYFARTAAVAQVPARAGADPHLDACDGELYTSG
jgi:hypothetical protein